MFSAPPRTIPAWDRHGLERLVRYCARPALSQERLGRVNEEMLVYSLKKPTFDGRTELYLTPLELLDRLAKLITPPRIHKHRYCGVLAPNAKLRKAVIETAGPAGATLQLLQDAQQKMGLEEAETEPASRGRFRKTAAHCWAMLLASHRRRRDRAAIPSMSAFPCSAPATASPCGSSRSCWIRQ